MDLFSFLSRLSVYSSKEMAPKCRENCPISGRRRMRRILSCLWLSCFFWPQETQTLRFVRPMHTRWTDSIARNQYDAQSVAKPPCSGKKKEPKPKLFGPDIFGWGGGLPREGVGPKSLVCPSKSRQTKLSGRTSRDFAGISRGARKV